MVCSGKCEQTALLKISYEPSVVSSLLENFGGSVEIKNLTITLKIVTATPEKYDNHQDIHRNIDMKRGISYCMATELQQT